ncbi:MAG: bifunctional phosphoribosyl-AMP cyclohydrolase/phosphoribosyl-ATP diphosphatase HisIE [Deltaproteobacteria bacterium]|nr:bifunctional phosphoribosyl-AMP cyclohydrolase/phosphoribosyl-ATP diphosphatase HisIE [Deltaproteobacteria bacterium]
MSGLLEISNLDSLTYDHRGLVPVVVQDAVGGAVLMLAYANQESLSLTLGTGYAHFWSRSRQELWKKGETSGNLLEVVEILVDCDRDALLMRAHPAGPTCHQNTRSCFEPNPVGLELGWLRRVLEERSKASPEDSYTARLLARGLPRIAQKVGEEAVESVIAALTQEGEERGELVGEVSDLLYHLNLLLLAKGVEPQEVAEELRRRHRKEPS